MGGGALETPKRRSTIKPRLGRRLIARQMASAIGRIRPQLSDCAPPGPVASPSRPSLLLLLPPAARHALRSFPESASLQRRARRDRRLLATKVRSLRIFSLAQSGQRWTARLDERSLGVDDCNCVYCGLKGVLGRILIRDRVGWPSSAQRAAPPTHPTVLATEVVCGGALCAAFYGVSHDRRPTRAAMGVLSLKVRIAERGVVKTMQFDPTTLVYDACKIIREKMPEATAGGQPKDYGLFLADDDPKKGVWMESGRTLEYYLVRNGDLLEYKKKLRTLKVRMLDGTVKMLMVDDSQPVGQMMIVICTKIGITNYEEYSMVRELSIKETDPYRSTGTLPKKEEKSGFGTLTLGRSKEKKMEQLRAKLHTDEELNWVDHSKTLREQGIEDTETLLLRRKYFFSDTNVDSRDPVQLNLLYVQCRDGVINGLHPVSKEEAIHLAGLQCQIQFGDFIETRHKNGGFLDLREFLPKEYVKTRDTEKKILQVYRQLNGLSELDAKVKYVHRCRSLKTYGVTFFLVKEKVKGKNKLVPRLLGINKECVMRVDEKTKDVLREWPLEQVRRWAASPNTFTLDFGDYQDGYYSVQTADGEKIAQLISGYIDIILKKKKVGDHLGIEGDEGSTMLEDVVSPAKATLMSHGQISHGYAQEGNVALPGVLRSGGDHQYSNGSLQRAQYGAVSGQVTSGYPPPGQKPRIIDTMTRSQRALVGTIEASIRAVEEAEEEMERPIELPHLGDDPASRKWRQMTLEVQKESVEDQLAAMGAATAEVVQLTAVPDEVDHTRVGAAISTISSNLPEMTKGVKTIAALMPEEERGDHLIEATRKLCGAFSDFLTAVNPIHDEKRTTVLAAAGRVGDFSQAMIQTIEEPSEEIKEFQDHLVQLAKSVATSTAQLVLRAKTVSAECDEPAQQDRVIHSATQCAFATSQLVACARVVAPTIDSPACQDQLTGAAKQVARAVEQLMLDAEGACKKETQKRSLGDIVEAARQVTRSLDELIGHIKTSPKQVRVTQQDQELETIITTSDRLISYQGSSSEMVRQAQVLAQATTHLVSHIKGEADTQPDNRDRLLGAARSVAQATTKMIEAAKDCQGRPQAAESQMALRTAAEDLQKATTEASADQIERRAIQRLEQAARVTASNATQTIGAANAAREYITTSHTQQEELFYQCTETAEYVPRLISSIKQSQNAQQPQEKIMAQSELVRQCTEVLQPCIRLVDVSQNTVPVVSDQSSALRLTTTSQQLSEGLAELRTALTRAQEVSVSMNLDYAIEVVRGLDDELDQFGRAAQQNQLYPVPGETAEGASTQLTTSTRVIGSALAQMLSATSRRDEQFVGVSAHDAAEGLRQLTGGVHGICATRRDAPSEKLIQSSRSVMQSSLQLFENVKVCLERPGDAGSQERLANVAKGVSSSLKECLSCLPGQQDFDAASQTIETMSRSVNISNIPPSARSYQEVQDDLVKSASRLTEATSRLVADTNKEPAVLRESLNNFVHTYKSFFSITLETTYHQQDQAVRQQMVSGIQTISSEASRLLSSVRASHTEPNNSTSRQQLTTVARSLAEAVNRLIDVCTSGAPWQNECDNALRQIEAVRHILENPVQPVSDLNYYECLDTVTEQSKRLGDGMTGIAHYAKALNMESFCQSVREVSNAVCGLAEGAAQAAYMVGVSDSNSTPGRSGLIESAKCDRSVQFVREVCERITARRYNQQQILDDATAVAKHTSTLANVCRDASNRTSNVNAKKHFINCARDVASSTATLITAVKKLDQSFSEQHQSECSQSAQSLLSAVNSLSAFVQSPEFASVPARIAAGGRQAQQPIVQAGKHMLDGSCQMIGTAKMLATSPKDPPTWQRLADNSKVVSESIKSLVSAIRDKAPGQNECDSAIERMNTLINAVDQASLAAYNQSLPARNDKSDQGYHQQILQAASQIQERIEGLSIAAKREAENLGHRVSQEMGHFEPLVDGCVGAASLSYNDKQQISLFDQCKTVAEAQLQLLYACKDAGGNPKARDFHTAVDEAAGQLREALTELQMNVQSTASEAGVVSGMVESISRSIARTDENVHTSQLTNVSFVDAQTRMVRACKEITRIAQEMVTKSYNDTHALGSLALELSQQYAQLAEDSRLAVAAAHSPDVAQKIRSAVQELGTGCIELVKQAGAVRAHPDDQFSKRELTKAAQIVTEKVQFVLSALHSGSKGTQACINAASTVSGIIGDLDTTIMFATAGTLNPDQSSDQFSDHRDAILKTAKALVEDTKALVAGAASNQEQLAVAAQNAVRTIVQLSDVVKSGATSLTSHNSEAQVMVIHAVRDVAAALSNLIQATKNASGRSLQDTAMTYLKDAAKVMVTNVTSLLKTVKTVEDEHHRGTRALEAAIEAIAQEIRSYDSSEAPTRTANPEDLLRVTRPITESTARAAAAGQSCQQEDVIVAANLARKAVFDLLTTAKEAAFSAESPETRYRALDAGRDVAIKVRELLQTLHTVLQNPSQEAKSALIPASRAIAQAVSDLVGFGEILKGEGWVDPSDPAVIAENELLGAANSIEAAAQKLMLLRPRRDVQAVDQNLPFDEQILEAAKSIASAVQALVKAASAAQRELVAQGRVDPRPLQSSEDYQWSEGLISAARMVAAAVHSLCEAANALVQGHATEERLISAAKQVAASTAHLLVACKVKADQNSMSMRRLQGAGHAVKTATEHLVHAAKKAIEAEDERTLIISQRMVSGIAQVMDAQEQVLRKERELLEARGKLSAIRKAKYKDHPAGSHE
uniref:Talin 1 n=1 Tax=Plectus sambesii TaxID=2011161 RepID=A0A914UKX2_9BILA